MTKVRDITTALEAFAPLSLAESWDNVGLLVGDQDAAVSNVLLCIDYTREVAEEAKDCELVVAYHPPIFSGVKRLLAGSPVFGAIVRGTALYSPHTALDAAKGGTNDVLAAAAGLLDCKPLKPHAGTDALKLVTFVPEAAVDKVSAALFEAGAGRIGHYSECSFRSPGTGTFFGDESTQPVVGKKGQRELAPELRLETRVTTKAAGKVVTALLASHPYETPAFDLVRLQAAPDATLGQGRIGRTEGTRLALIEQLKRELGLQHLLVAGETAGKAKRVAVAAGAGAGLLDDAIAQKVDVFVTGELKHHDALRANARGVTVVMTLHSNSERKALETLAKVIPCNSRVSTKDRDPFSVV
jgi:dinuclear metal center YbgI/SA1388 family protein